MVPNTILIVEDESDLADTLSDLIQGFGFDTRLASNGQEGLSIYENHRNEIALIICDINMPVMNGLEFFRRGLEKYSIFPVIMLTAHTEINVVTDAIKLGAIDYLVKPFEIKPLEKKLYLWIEIAKRQKDSAQFMSESAKREALLRIRNVSDKKS